MLDGDKLPTLQAERVALRWLADPDVDALYEIFSHPEVVRYWSSPQMTSRREAEALLTDIHRYFRERSLFQWGVELLSEGKIIGTCTLAHLDARNRRAEIGYALSHDHWGNGLMKEALTTLFDFAFGAMGLHRIEADVDPDNVTSIALLERLGFRHEGYLRERWLVAGAVHDSLLLGLLAKEWQAVRPR
jgi:[ribosomal protein S5]-alanine N-acetyltransferase